MLKAFSGEMGRSRFGKGDFKEESGGVDTIFAFIPAQRSLGISFESDLVVARLCLHERCHGFPACKSKSGSSNCVREFYPPHKIPPEKAGPSD